MKTAKPTLLCLVSLAAVSASALIVRADVFASGEPGQEEQLARYLLQKHPNIKAVVSTTTTSSMASMKVLKEPRFAGKPRHIGFGVLLPTEARETLAEGRLSAWLAQDPRRIGRQGIEVALSLVEGK